MSAESKLNTTKDLISKVLHDGQMSEGDFKHVLDDCFGKVQQNERGITY